MDRAPATDARAARVDGWIALAWVGGIALVAQAWIAALPFQLDDHLLLLDPAGLFHESSRFAAPVDGAPAPTMLRWTLWGLWLLLAKLGGAPLSPLLFHSVGLALHAACCMLVAAVATRLFGARVAPARPWLPGAIAGAGMALSAGAIEAVAWASAWGDALALSFACASLLVLLRARGRPGALALGGACALLALLSKESALVFPPLLALLLWSAARADGRATPRTECAVLALALAAYLALRVLVLGGLNLSAGGGALTAADLPRRALAAVVGLVQALFPHNRAPEFADQVPLVARGRAALLVYVAWGGVFALACCASRAALRSAALALAALALLLAPTLLIALGARTNVLSRAEYAPLACAWLLWGAALVNVWSSGGPRARGRRWLAAACAAIQLGAALDLRAHVVATTQLAVEQIEALDRCVDEARTEHARSGAQRPLTLVLIAGEPGLGGIALVGEHARFRYAPPFAAGPIDAAQLARARAQGRSPAHGSTRAGAAVATAPSAGATAAGTAPTDAATAGAAPADAAPVDAAPAFELRAWGTRNECEREWPWAELGTRDLVWIGPSGDALLALARGAAPSDVRAARLPRARSALVAGLDAARADSLAWRREPAPGAPAGADAALRYVPSTPVPAHSLGALELAFEAGPATRVQLELEAGKRSSVHELALAAGDGELRRVACGRIANLDRLFGPPVHAFTLRDAATASAPDAAAQPQGLTQPPGLAQPPELAHPPRLAYLPRRLDAPPAVAVREPSGELLLSADRAPRLVLGSRLPPLAELDVRLEIALQLPIGRIAIHASARDASPRDPSAHDTSPRDTSPRDTSPRDTSAHDASATHANSDAEVELELDAFRFDAWPAEIPSLPWPQFHALWLAPQFAQRGRSELAAAARVVLVTRTEAPARPAPVEPLIVGASTWQALRIRL